MMPPMPVTFPEEIFREFRQSAARFFPTFQQDENSVPRQYFVRSSQAVGHRYRTCVECNEEFKGLLRNAPERWREWNDDPEHSYKLERCLHAFFMNGLSVFESLGFCLYFSGGALRPSDFPHVQNPKRITLKVTGSAFTAAFAQSQITTLLVALPQEPKFRKIESVRNILAHRVSSMRSVRGYGTLGANGEFTHTTEEVLYLPGEGELNFGEELIQDFLDWITSKLTALVGASCDFARSQP
jgi:hypothetical protein